MTRRRQSFSSICSIGNLVVLLAVIGARRSTPGRATSAAREWDVPKLFSRYAPHVSGPAAFLRRFIRATAPQNLSRREHVFRVLFFVLTFLHHRITSNFRKLRERKGSAAWQRFIWFAFRIIIWIAW